MFSISTNREKGICVVETISQEWNSHWSISREAEQAESKADFIHKLAIALKEANETDYWLLLLKEGGYLDKVAFESIHTNCVELLKLLTSIIKTSRGNL